MTLAADAVFRPAIPPRRTGGPLSLLPFLWISWRDPIRMWSERHFTEPQLYGNSAFGEILVVSHPEGVRHVLTENASSYVKGDLQRRVLGPMLAEGLLLTEGDAWRRVRRILAPLFTPAKMATLNARMAEVCQARVAGWSLSARGRVLDIDSEMSGLTFDILSATMFSDELGGEARGFERALNQFLANGARIDPLDVLGAPDWAPRLGRLASFGSARFFEQRVTRLVEARRARIEAGDMPPQDLHSALLLARAENGGPGLSDAEVAASSRPPRPWPARPWPTTRSAVSRSRPAPPSSSRRGFCNATACCGTTLTPSGRSASCPGTASPSTAMPTFPSAPAPASASAPPSPFRRR